MQNKKIFPFCVRVRVSLDFITARWVFSLNYFYTRSHLLTPSILQFWSCSPFFYLALIRSIHIYFLPFFLFFVLLFAVHFVLRNCPFRFLRRETVPPVLSFVFNSISSLCCCALLALLVFLVRKPFPAASLAQERQNSVVAFSLFRVCLCSSLFFLSPSLPSVQSCVFVL